MMPFEPLDPDQEKPFAEYCAEVARQLPLARAECERETGRLCSDAEPDLWTLRHGFYYEIAPLVCAAQAFVEEGQQVGEFATAWDERLSREFSRAMNSKPCAFPEATAERCPFCDGALSASRDAVEKVLNLACHAEDCVGYMRFEGIMPWTGARRTEGAKFKPAGLHIVRRDSRVEVCRGESVVTFDAGEESFVDVFRIAVAISTTPS